MATPAEQIRDLREMLAASETRLALAEDRVAQLQATVEKILENQERMAERQVRTEERMSVTEKESDKWSGRVWQIILALWTTVMGLLGAVALITLGFKK